MHKDIILKNENQLQLAMRTVYVALTWKESVRPKIYSQSTRYLLCFFSPQDTPTKVRTQMASPSTESSTERARCAAPNWAANCPLLSSAFLQTSFPPFLRPTKLTLPETSGVPDFIRQFHSSVASATQRCVALLQLFASQNPFLNRLSSLSAHFSQVCVYMNHWFLLSFKLPFVGLRCIDSG